MARVIVPVASEENRGVAPAPCRLIPRAASVSPAIGRVRDVQPASYKEPNVVVSDERLKPVAQLGWYTIALFFGVLGGWSVVAPLGGAVVAPGFLKVEGNRRAVQHLDGGIVSDLNVHEGDHVEAGGVLLRIDRTEAAAELGVLEQQSFALRLTQARARAELMGEDALVFPADVGTLPQDSETAALWAAQQRQFDARRRSLAGQRAVVAEKIAQLEAQRRGSERQLESRRAQLASMVAERDSLAPLVERGVVTRQRLAQVERSVAQTEGEAGEFAAAIAQATQGIAEQNRVAAQLGNEQLSDASRELRETQASLIELLPKLANARAKLQRTEVRAPATGRIVGLSVFTPGAVVGRGEKLMDIVPDHDGLVVEARIAVEQIADLHPGMRANIQLTALKDHATPEITGTVSHVSADRLTEERTGRAYYTVNVQPGAGDLGSKPNIALYPGMPATVLVPTRPRTAFRYLVDPLLEAMRGAFRER